MKIRILTALALVCLAGISPALADSVSERSERAKAEFGYKNFTNTIEILSELLYPTVQLTTEDDIAEAREMLGLSYFYIGEEKKAKREFIALLYLRPRHRLDAFLVPPPAVAFFDGIRKDPAMKSKLEKIMKEREQEAKNNKPQPKTLVRRTFLQRDRIERSRLVAFLPFGIGQCQNGHTTKGVLLATGGGLSLLTNIACYSLLVALANEEGKYNEEDLDLARGLRIGQYVGLGLFAATWIYGAIDANIYFEPTELEPYKKVKEEEQFLEKNSTALLPTAVPGGAGLSFRASF